LHESGFEADLQGEDRTVHAVNALDEAREGEITFLSNPKYLSAVVSTNASAIILKDGIPVPDRISSIRCSDPYGAVTVAIIIIHGPRKHPRWGLSPQATIHATAKVGENPNIAGGVTIDADALIGDNCTIYPGCYIANGVCVGHDCTLFPNVVVYDGSVLGNRVTVHAGSIIGEDGLGYAPRDGRWVKIPQVGLAVIGDDVEIGANCTIDRATLGRTQIGSGTKFGNVVVIGHGTKVGPDCLFVGQVGIAGSVTVGRHVTLAGQDGVAGHLEIGDDVTAGAQSGIAGNVAAKSTVFGSPALPIDNAKRSFAALAKLPAWILRIRELEREVRELRAEMNGNGLA
jgi:UDP-3-O-[3-hydroxymyristoyl] glucosamine N-acyltransferase